MNGSCTCARSSLEIEKRRRSNDPSRNVASNCGFPHRPGGQYGDDRPAFELSKRDFGFVGPLITLRCYIENSMMITEFSKRVFDPARGPRRCGNWFVADLCATVLQSTH